MLYAVLQSTNSRQSKVRNKEFEVPWSQEWPISSDFISLFNETWSLLEVSRHFCSKRSQPLEKVEGCFEGVQVHCPCWEQLPLQRNGVVNFKKHFLEWVIIWHVRTVHPISYHNDVFKFYFFVRTYEVRNLLSPARINCSNVKESGKCLKHSM